MTERMKRLEAEREERKKARLIKEIERTKSLMVYEEKYRDQQPICGIDEVGRGPLAGPVLAGAVILPSDHMIYGINDSKKLTPKKRDELYAVIMEEAVAVGFGIESEESIDSMNILQATYAAMRKAVASLKVTPNLLLVDAVTIPMIDIPQCSIIKGDAKSVSIGAASIVAKVTRDRMMEEYDSLYPEYHFASNKGYGTAEHIEALRKYGPCPIHRKSFLGKILGNVE